MFLNKFILSITMKKEHLFLPIFILIFITGCNGSITGLGSGPNGVQIKFIQPEDVLLNAGIKEGSVLPIEIELTNYGQCMAIGKLCIRDTLSDSFGGVNDQCKDINLREVQTDTKKVQLSTQKYNFFTQSYSNLFKDQETSLLATAKYSCDIITGPRKLCTKSIYDKNDPQCNPVETISGSSLGAKIAPVTVTSVYKTLSLESSSNLKLNAEITLGKMGDGKVAGLDTNPESESLKGNPLKISVDYAGSEMSCRENDGRIIQDGIIYWKIDENEKVINCEILLNSVEYNENPLNVHLNYEYEITQSKLVKIKHIQKEGS